MNIFVTDYNPQLAAIDHCDKHVVKMVLETAQMLSTCMHLKGFNVDGLYKKTHVNHPCVKWLMESENNIKWTIALGRYLASEYFIRFGRRHKSSVVINKIANEINWIPNTRGYNNTPFIIAAPADIKEYAKEVGVVNAYRVYIASAKRSFAKWERNSAFQPEWWDDACSIADKRFPHIVNTKNDGVA